MTTAGKRLALRAADCWRPARWVYVALRTLVVRPIQWWRKGSALRRAAAAICRDGRYRVRWIDQPWFVDPSARRPVRFVAEFPDASIPLTLSLERGYYDLDGFTHAAHYGAARAIAERMAEHRDQGTRVHVLDAACGSGHGAAILATVPGVEYTGVDLDADLIRYAQRRYSDLPGDYRQGDVTELPWVGDGALSLFVSIETVEHVDRDARYVAEAQRMLAQDGVMFVTTPRRQGTHHSGNAWHPREYSAAALSDLFAGWRIESLTETGGTLVMVARPPRRAGT